MGVIPYPRQDRYFPSSYPAASALPGHLLQTCHQIKLHSPVLRWAWSHGIFLPALKLPLQNKRLPLPSLLLHCLIHGIAFADEDTCPAITAVHAGTGNDQITDTSQS